MAATRWILDNTHSSAEFEVQHMQVSTYHNRFRTLRGTVELDETGTDSKIDVAIDARSIPTDDKGLYDKLVGEDFFHVEKHPEILFKSTRVAKGAGDLWSVEGELTLRGVTHPVQLEVHELGERNNPFAKRPMRAFRGKTSIRRSDYGLKWNVVLDTGAPYLGEQVFITLQLELLEAV